jgi:hypothetical protein
LPEAVQPELPSLIGHIANLAASAAAVSVRTRRIRAARNMATTTIPKRRYGKLGQQRHLAPATAAEVSPNPDRAVKRDIHQRALVKAVGLQRTMYFTLRTVIRPVQIGIGKLFRISLDRASKAA